MEYYSAIKKDDIMPSAATWMELENLILSEMSQKGQRQIPYDITYNWNLISSTNEHLLRKENQSWTWRRDLWLPDGRGREWEGSGAWASQTQLRIDLQGDPTE